MSASPSTVAVSVQWTPPGAQANSGNAAYNVQQTYNGQSAGQIDVAPATAPATVIPIPFGNIQQAKTIIVKNNMSSDVGIRLNGAVADQFRIPSQGFLAFSAPFAPTGAPLGLITSVSMSTTATPLVPEQVNYTILGD